MRLTVVPGRNTIMLSIAMGVAQNIKFDYVSYANHQGDHRIYPDCRKDYVNLLDTTFDLATEGQVRLFTPFSDLSKNEIAKLGLILGIDYDKETWTCYKGELLACGKCGACTERKEALEYAGYKTTSPVST